MYIQTRNGGTFSLTDPDPEDVNLADIGWALAHLCRYTGHVRAFYSVAQHSVMAAKALRDRGHDRLVVLQGLLHDAAEAYVGDVASPLKALLPEYRKVEERVWRVICQRFHIPVDLAPPVKRIDLELLMWEAPDLVWELVGDGWPHGVPPAYPGDSVFPWDPRTAFVQFMDEARRLEVS